MVVNTNPSGSEHVFELTGGRLCLDFVNTVSGDRTGTPRERIAEYADLVAWARQSCAIEAPHARRLLAESRKRPGDAEAVAREALALRETLWCIFSAVAERRDPRPADLAAVSAQLARALVHRRIERKDGGYALSWDDPPGALEAPLWRVVASASDVLTSGADLDRVRVCGMHETRECSWVFVDQTRARTRRWCSMKVCGNKAKSRRHYERVKQGS